MSEQPMEPLWQGRRFRLYLARRGQGFVYPGVHLWTGKRHVRVLPFRKG